MRHPFRKFLDQRRKNAELSGIRKAARDLEIARLTSMDGDAMFTLIGSGPPGEETRLFGYYTAEGVDYALEKLGVYDRIRARGYQDLRAGVSGDVWRQDLRVHGRAGGERHLVLEGRFRRHVWSPPEYTPIWKECGERDFHMVDIEWLLLQSPAEDFTSSRPRLPGQQHPGLGLRDEIMEVFYAVARRLRLDGYLINPKLFHNAVMYSPMFFFIRPERQAQLNAVVKSGRGRPLQDLSMAVEGGRLYIGDGPPCKWTGETMIRPLSQDLLGAFHRCGFRRTVEDMTDRCRVRFDWEGFESERPELAARLRESHFPASPLEAV